MPPKRSTRANPTGKNHSNIQPLEIITPAQARKLAGKTKVVQKEAPVIVTPLKSKAKKDTPVGKKKNLLVGAKKLYAVMNVKTGATTIVTSFKTGQKFIKQFNGMSKGNDEEVKLFEFDTKEDMDAASAEIETNADPATAKSIQAATLPLATTISLVTSNLKKPPTSNPMADLKQRSPAPISTGATKPSLSLAMSNEFANLKPRATINLLADKLQSDLSGSMGTCARLFLLPPTVCVADQEMYQVFAIDLIENRNGQTLWTHKPDAWLRLFTMDRDLSLDEGGQRADPFFHNLLVGYQRSQPKGPNVQKTMVTKNSKTIDYQVLWGMIKCTDDTEATLKTELMKFSTLASDTEIQEAYQVTVKALGTKFEPLLEQICPTSLSNPKLGEYWKKLSACFAGNITIIQCASMNELFMDEEITMAVGFLWPDARGLSTSMWSGEMNKFAFGRT
jgi:hypothetical protein